MLLPSMFSTAEKVAALIAAERLTGAAIRLEAYRSRHGNYPASLSGLLPADELKDPFTGRPLASQIDADGFRVYSAGPDRADSGGTRMKHIDGPVRKLPGDIVFQVSHRP